MSRRTGHIMLDIETMGRKPGCAIVSIGACVFGPDGVSQEEHAKFYTAIDLEGQGTLTLDPSTVKWWLTQSESARSALSGNNFTPVQSLQTALSEFDAWYYRIHAEYGHPLLWANGPDFDPPIMEAAYAAAGFVKHPWPYNTKRCVRTAMMAAGLILKDFNYGTAHNALDDAIAQAMGVAAALTKLEGVR